MYILLPETQTPAPVPYFLLAQRAPSVLFDEGHFVKLELVKCKQAVLRDQTRVGGLSRVDHIICASVFLSEHTLCALSAVPSNEVPAASFFILSFSSTEGSYNLFGTHLFHAHRHAASQNQPLTSNSKKRLRIKTSLWDYFLTLYKHELFQCNASRPGSILKPSIWGENVLFVSCTEVLWECIRNSQLPLALKIMCPARATCSFYKLSK